MSLKCNKFTLAKVRTWLPAIRAVDAREAVCESVGYVAGVVSPDVVEPVLPLLLQFLTTTMRSASKDIVIALAERARYRVVLRQSSEV